MSGKYFFLAAIFLAFIIVLSAPFSAQTADEPSAGENGIMEKLQNLLNELRGAEEKDSSSPAENPAMQEPTPDAGEASCDTGAPEQKSWPGVTNKLLKKGGKDFPCINVYYPSFGNPAVDKAMLEFAEKAVDDYMADVKESFDGDEQKPPSFDMWDMSGHFSVSRPCPDVASVTFNIYTYSGGAHGNLQIHCLNYDLRTGKEVDFADLFKDPKKALEILSSQSPQKLRAMLGDDADEDMIKSGTSDDLANFSNLSLTPEGLVVEFQPYQVGPWSIGPQSVPFSLLELEPAGPEENIWPQRKENSSSIKEN